MSDGADQEDRTEEPTQRKLDKAIEQGDVAKSQEVSTFFMLGALILALMLSARGAADTFTVGMRGFLGQAHLVPDDAGGLIGAGWRALLVAGQVIAMPLGILTLAAIAGGMVQHRPLWTFEPLMPKASRLSPMSGASRIFGKQALVQFVKGLLKIIVVGTVASVVLWRDRDRLESFATLPPAAFCETLLTLAIKLLASIMAIYAAVAIGDAVYQRFAWHKRQRMSKEEIKQESKEQNGNPEIKGKIRQLRMQRVKKRMMAAVPSATVVITNPTHYAVALKYEQGMEAPICVAKGLDAVALRIRAVASEHDVPVMENPPLARALHATVEIDAPIPVEHYKAVAEVIGFVLRLKRRVA